MYIVLNHRLFKASLPTEIHFFNSLILLEFSYCKLLYLSIASIFFFPRSLLWTCVFTLPYFFFSSDILFIYKPICWHTQSTVKTRPVCGPALYSSLRKGFVVSSMMTTERSFQATFSKLPQYLTSSFFLVPFFCLFHTPTAY